LQAPLIKIFSKGTPPLPKERLRHGMFWGHQTLSHITNNSPLNTRTINNAPLDTRALDNRSGT
jgi:hypothetical protein